MVVTPEELETRVRATAKGLTFSTDDLAGVTSVLAGEGVLHALPYGRLIVLQPSWVNGYASTLVKLAGEAQNRLGHVPMDLIQPNQLPADGTPRLSLEDERQFLPALQKVDFDPKIKREGVGPAWADRRAVAVVQWGVAGSEPRQPVY